MNGLNGHGCARPKPLTCPEQSDDRGLPRSPAQHSSSHLARQSHRASSPQVSTRAHSPLTEHVEVLQLMIAHVVWQMTRSFIRSRGSSRAVLSTNSSASGGLVAVCLWSGPFEL